MGVMAERSNYLDRKIAFFMVKATVQDLHESLTVHDHFFFLQRLFIFIFFNQAVRLKMSRVESI
jgi:hypothetical protein